MALLAAVGNDLPGAVEIETAVDGPDHPSENGFDELIAPDATEPDDSTLRFSLAGVQLKFSVLREAEKLTLPAKGERGEWIVKLDSSRFPHLVENELAVLEWARASGLEVPECHLQSAETLALPLRSRVPQSTSLLVIRRYDRDGPRRIHQEDFAQVAGLPPERKYDHVTYEQCAALVRAIVGEDGYLELIRRLAFVVASGNTDAHLKNWSFVYPDGVSAVLSPLYDQVCTIAWPEVTRSLALKLAGRKDLLQIDEAAFERLAVKAGADVSRTLATLRDSLQRFAEAWSTLASLMPPEHLSVLRSYWERSALLRRYANTADHDRL